MIKGLMGTSIWSEDLNNLLPFYRDTLGLKLTMTSPGFVEFGDENGAILALGTHSEVKGKAGDPYRHFVCLHSDSLHADYERLRDAGVKFIEAPASYGDWLLATSSTRKATSSRSPSTKPDGTPPEVEPNDGLGRYTRRRT